MIKFTSTAALALLATTGLTACDDSIWPSGGDRATVVITQQDAGRPALFFGSADGSQRTRIHLTNVADSIPGNLASLVVNDTTLLALSSPSIGGRIAVVATVAFDQSEIVVVGIDGKRAEVASINTQIIGSEPSWSPDGNQLAYTMSTLPGLGRLDLFVTDLPSHTVTRLTTAGNLANATVRWSLDGKSIFYARTTGVTTDGLDNRLSEIVRVDVATKTSQVVVSNVLGQITSLDQSGNGMLLTRNVAVAGGTARQLILKRVGGTEQIVVAADAAYGRFTSDPIFAVVATATRTLNVLRIDAFPETIPIAGLTTDANVDAVVSRPIG